MSRATPLEHRDEQAGETRERIFQAALELFSGNGYDGTSVREIAEAAGISKPALYYYYGSKERLYTEIIQSCFERARLTLEPAVREPGPLRTRLRRTIQAHFDYFAEHRDAMRLLYAAAFSVGKDEPSFDVWELERPHMEMLVSIFQEAQAAGETGKINPAQIAFWMDGMMNNHLMAFTLLGWELSEEQAYGVADFVADALLTRKENEL